MTDDMETHDVAVVIIVRTEGVDHGDAMDRARAIVAHTLRPHVDDDGKLVAQLRPTDQTALAARLLRITDIGSAAVSGYVTLQVTGRAARERGLTDD